MKPLQSEHCAKIILGLHDECQAGFTQITRRSRGRFERREWHEFQGDATERLAWYRTVVDAGVGGLIEKVGDHSEFPPVKSAYAALIKDRGDTELAETFFNSLTRRLFVSKGVDPERQFVDSDLGDPPPDAAPEFYRRYSVDAEIHRLVKRILEDLGFETPYENLERDAKAVAERIETHLSGRPLDAVDVLRPMFYRNKGCYVIGRLRCGDAVVPLALPLLNGDGGIYVDAVLLEAEEVSIVFSFTRSYFFCDTDRPADVIAFLRTIMPIKPINELYNSLGYNKHGKTLLYRDMMRHLTDSDEPITVARGEKGMVMLVFNMPSFDVVFKIIRDVFAPPKNTTRAKVKEQYQLVFTHDRAGRLVDAQEFMEMTFRKDRFAPELLKELLTEASYTVKDDGDDITISHMYTERRLIPLNIYLADIELEAAKETIVDYGQALKDLISANIFPGDLLLKNFGVTRHGRVIFYDYDELCLITECNFRAIPEQSVQDELWGEGSYSVGENDIFPEELRYFLGLRGELRDEYERHHGDLFEVDYWLKIQRRIREGWIADIYPYKESRRLPR